MDNVIFPELTFSKPGIYCYTIKELTPSSFGWTTDKSVYRAIVTVEYNCDGELEARVDYPDGNPCFCNKFLY